MILNCFISGLVPKIKREIIVLQPTSITQAMGLVKLLESKIHDLRKYNCNPIIPQTSPHLLPPPRPPFQPQTTTTTPTYLPITKLSSTQLQEHRAIDLCYNCDDFFFLVTNVSTNVSYCYSMKNLHQKPTQKPSLP